MLRSLKFDALSMTDQALYFKLIISIFRLLFPGIEAVKVFSHILGGPRELCGKIADPNNKLPFQV